MERRQTLGGYTIDLTPEPLPGGRFAACARLTRLEGGASQEVWPEFDAFNTEAEAVSAAHMAALAWIAHQNSRPGASP